jgi:hypothetical protein
MYRARHIVAVLLIAAFMSVLTTTIAQAQRRKRPRTSPPPPTRNNRPLPPASNPADSLLTGVYRLDPENSDNPRDAVEEATGYLPFGMDEQDMERLNRRLTSPQQLAIERRGTSISIASTRSPRITFDADGRERVEKANDGEQVRTRAVLYGDQLMVNYTGGSRAEEFSVSFDPIDDGRRLRVTRRIYEERLGKPLVIQSIYDKVSNVARWNVYGMPESSTVTARNNRPSQPAINPNDGPQPPASSPQPLPSSPPASTTPGSVPTSPPTDVETNSAVYALIVPDGTEFVATLNNDLSTAVSREGDPFTMTVRSPAQYEGAVIEGYVSRIKRGGRVSGRAEMLLDFRQIRLRDGRTAGFSGFIENVSAEGGEEARIDREGGEVQERDSQSNRTAQRTAIGAAIGALIGAIADGGKGAAIGAAVGAGVGASSVYAQGRDDLELRRGTEMTVRASRRAGQGG